MNQDPIAQAANDHLLGRSRERDELDRLLNQVRSGRSQVLVLRGEAGIGKSALLDHLAAQAAQPTHPAHPTQSAQPVPAVPMQVVRTAGAEAETDFAYSALQSLCAPLLPHLDRLPPVQQQALRVAFGLSAGDPPEMLLVGLAVLGLLSEAAAESPLLCLIDDAQWLDPVSQRILTFVARRLDAESVALVFAERTEPTGLADTGITGLPELLVPGLPDAEARALLDTARAASRARGGAFHGHGSVRRTRPPRAARHRRDRPQTHRRRAGADPAGDADRPARHRRTVER